MLFVLGLFVSEITHSWSNFCSPVMILHMTSRVEACIPCNLDRVGTFLLSFVIDYVIVMFSLTKSDFTSLLP
jgi:hypothetical protein